MIAPFGFKDFTFSLSHYGSEKKVQLVPRPAIYIDIQSLITVTSIYLCCVFIGYFYKMHPNLQNPNVVVVIDDDDNDLEIISQGKH